MTSITPVSSSVRPVALDVAVTLGGVALLVVLGKLIALAGAAMSLPDACWQMLAVRALAGGAVVSGVMAAGRGRYMWLFGVGYGLALLGSHTGAPLLYGATVGGVVATFILAVRPTWKLVATLVFMVGLATPALVRKVGRSGWAGAWEWSVDLGIRLLAAGLAVWGVLWVVGKVKARASSRA